MSAELMTYPFPIRRGGRVYFVLFSLPDDLTADEAERLGVFLTSLATRETDERL